MSHLPRVHIEEQVVHQDAPVVTKDLVVQHPEIIRHEHHVQPVIHETERHVRPVVKTRVTTEHPVSYREVVVEEPVEGAQREASTVVVEDPPIVSKRVVHVHPEIIHHEHHIQPIIRETERHIEPIHKTEITTEHPITYQEVVVKEPALVARPHVVHTREAGSGAVPHHRHPSHATLGQKLKGTMNQFVGTITGNEARKERGRLLKQGVEVPSTRAATTTTAGTTAVTDVYTTPVQSL
jgi:hypothetical protein